MITKIMSNEVEQVFGYGQCQCIHGSFLGDILSLCGDPWGIGTRFETTEILSMSNVFDIEQNCKSTCCSKTGTIGYMHSFSNTGALVRKSCLDRSCGSLVRLDYSY